MNTYYRVFNYINVTMEVKNKNKNKVSLFILYNCCFKTYVFKKKIKYNLEKNILLVCFIVHSFFWWNETNLISYWCIIYFGNRKHFWRSTYREHTPSHKRKEKKGKASCFSLFHFYHFCGISTQDQTHSSKIKKTAFNEEWHWKTLICSSTMTWMRKSKGV